MKLLFVNPCRNMTILRFDKTLDCGTLLKSTSQQLCSHPLCSVSYCYYISLLILQSHFHGLRQKMSLLLGVSRIRTKIGNEVNTLASRCRSRKIYKLLRSRKVTTSTLSIFQQPAELEIEDGKRVPNHPRKHEMQSSSIAAMKLKSPVNFFVTQLQFHAVVL